MARVTIELPSVLSPIIDGGRSVDVEADTVTGALRALIERHPALDVHLFDETGELRRHVLCFHNRTNTRWLESAEVPLADRDTITILQAVSGG
ncbi:MAG: MoaD/ThiS family protein [Planctomycetota bacterium]